MLSISVGGLCPCCIAYRQVSAVHSNSLVFAHGFRFYMSSSSSSSSRSSYGNSSLLNEGGSASQVSHAP